MINLSNQPVVIDCGTGFTKIGYAGNSKPLTVFPTTIAYRSNRQIDRSFKSLEDLDYRVGANALGNSNYIPTNPIKHGIIQDWNSMERIFDYSIYHQLHCNPEDHYFLITEPFNNTPENREYTAEVMFETFNVPGMYIATQAVLCLYANGLVSSSSRMDSAVSGVVVDAGEGGTSIIPVSDGYVLGASVKTLPLGGCDISEFILRRLRERNEPVPSEDILEAVRAIKENMCYCCGNMMKEFTLFDEKRSCFQTCSGIGSRTRRPWTIDVGYEQFLAPELFFNPEILNPEYTTPLADLVYQAVMSCPVDTRRGLFSNIVAAGGSTKFRGFTKRLQRDINRLVKARYEANIAAVRTKLYGNVEVHGKQMEVVVNGPKHREIAAWLGGSYVASQNEFVQACITRAEYEEKGAKVARKNALVKIDY